jgi:DNA-binding MarR family transcriptional regulator
MSNKPLTRKAHQRRGDMSRTRLVREVKSQWRELSQAMLLFQTRAADHFGLAISDLKAIDVLSHAAALSAGDLAARCSLTPGAVTGLLNRLERAKVVRRRIDPRDARRTIIQLVGEPRHRSSGDRVVKSLNQSLGAIAVSFSNDELASILAFLTESTRAIREQADTIP